MKHIQTGGEAEGERERKRINTESKSNFTKFYPELTCDNKDPQISCLCCKFTCYSFGALLGLI